MTKVDPTKIHRLHLSAKQPGFVRRNVAMFFMWLGSSIFEAAEEFMLRGFDFKVVEETFDDE